MSWFKVDDKLWGHPKWLATPPRARALWITAGSWCAAQEQDGKVPEHVLPMLGASKADARALVAAGLWEDGENGWVFHGWAEFQPTRAQQEEKREAARERMRKARERRANESENEPDSSEGVRANSERTSRGVRSTPTRPDPTPSPNGEGTALSSGADAPDGEAFSPDVERLCQELAGLVRANGHKATVGAQWRRQCRLLIDADGWTPEQIVWVMRWATSDPFWSANIRSMPKLREKFTELKARALAARDGGPQRAAARPTPGAEARSIVERGLRLAGHTPDVLEIGA